jgi:hypothetical protein
MFLFAKPPEEDIGYFSCIRVTQMFTVPTLIATAIAATRMYRSLTDFCSLDVYVIPLRRFLSALTECGLSHHSGGSDGPRLGGPRMGSAKPTSTFTVVSVPPRLEIATHMTHEECAS